MSGRRSEPPGDGDTPVAALVCAHVADLRRRDLVSPRGSTRRGSKPGRHPWRETTIVAVLVLALGTFGGVEIYGRSPLGAFVVAVVVLALIGLILASGNRR
jgi:hypothetical protein